LGTRERKEREKRRRRRDILDAARELFWEHGYVGTTMPQIAQAAELAPGTLYLYFPSKQALYSELLVEGYDLLLERMQAARKAGGPPRRQAAALIDAFLQFAHDCPEYFDIIFFVLHWGGTESARGALEPEQAGRLEAKESACKAIAGQVLSGARSADVAGGGEHTLDAVWSMLVGVVFYFRKQGDERFAVVATEARRLLLDSLFGVG
jgi:AcrR family transcriptional regulator